jgi:hypothetical protein
MKKLEDGEREPSEFKLQSNSKSDFLIDKHADRCSL